MFSSYVNNKGLFYVNVESRRLLVLIKKQFLCLTSMVAFLPEKQMGAYWVHTFLTIYLCWISPSGTGSHFNPSKWFAPVGGVWVVTLPTLLRRLLLDRFNLFLLWLKSQNKSGWWWLAASLLLMLPLWLAHSWKKEDW